ncbi:MAG: hypothetical protein OFPI_44550 [Osedax symbiont Rs2]|nr:MAG: hypothetical protein OFPI_44550 [Osedax symbiont Rs2]
MANSWKSQMLVGSRSLCQSFAVTQLAVAHLIAYRIMHK